MRFLCAAVLAMEAIAVALGIAPAITLADVDPAAAVGGGLAIAAACLVVAACLRWSWAYAAGSVLQGVIIATGLVLPAMAIVGAAFASLWGLAIYLGGRVERIRRERGIPDR
jgi:Protein of unknown function (DUF4233)